MQKVIMPFESRSAAGRLLAERLLRFRNVDQGIVLGIPRGGMPVAYEVAKALSLPLDVLVVRRIQVPGEKNLSLGAVAPGGVRVLNQDVVRAVQAPAKVIDALAAAEIAVMERRDRAYRGDRTPPGLRGRTVILVDDRLASGATLRAAALWVRAQGPARVIAAIPVAVPEACWAVRYDVDDLIYGVTPGLYHTLPTWYRDFPDCTDERVRQMIRECASQVVG